MEKLKIKAEERKTFGRKVKRLRTEGKLPANVSGKDFKSTSVSVDTKEFSELFKSAGETKIINLALGKEDLPVLIHNIQVDSVTGAFLHVDFIKIDLKQKISANIPLDFVGESPAEKSGTGVVVTYADEVEVEALPSDLPEKFEIDISKLEEVDSFVSIKDIKYDKEKVEIKDDPEKVLVKIEAPKEEEVVEVKEEATEEQPVEGEAAKEVSEEGGKESEKEATS